MKDKKRIRMLLFFLVFLGAVVLVFSLLALFNMSEFSEWTAIIISACAVLVSAISGAFIVFQLASDNEIEIKQHRVEQESFILEYNQSFLGNDDLCEVNIILKVN